MHEKAAIQHTRFKWIGKIRRAPDGDRAGAFYRNDTTCFYVVWEAGTAAEGGLPDPGWYPSADLVRVA